MESSCSLFNVILLIRNDCVFSNRKILR